MRLIWTVILASLTGYTQQDSLMELITFSLLLKRPSDDLKRSRSSCFTSDGGKPTDANTYIHSYTISNSLIQKHREHAFIRWSKQQHRDYFIKTRRTEGRKQEHILSPLLIFFATIINRVFTDEVVRVALM